LHLLVLRFDQACEELFLFIAINAQLFKSCDDCALSLNACVAFGQEPMTLSNEPRSSKWRTYTRDAERREAHPSMSARRDQMLPPEGAWVAEAVRCRGPLAFRRYTAALAEATERFSSGMPRFTRAHHQSRFNVLGNAGHRLSAKVPAVYPWRQGGDMDREQQNVQNGD
jgi:hypothetical protein